MKKMMPSFTEGLLLCLLAIGVQSTAYAGNSSTDTGSCSIDAAAGTGHCQGTYADIKNQAADPSRWAAFRKSVFNTSAGSGGLEFAMVVSGRMYVCYGNSAMLDAWNTVMASGHGIWFSINFKTTGNLSGQCTFLFVDSSSANR